MYQNAYIISAMLTSLQEAIINTDMQYSEFGRHGIYNNDLDFEKLIYYQ